MAREEIATNTDTMKGDIDVLRAALKNAVEQLEKVQTEVVELDGMWNGPANEEFNRYFQRNYANSKDMLKAVDGIIGCMEFAQREYVKCENEVSSIIGSISV